jgi:hypothetical protein
MAALIRDGSIMRIANRRNLRTLSRLGGAASRDHAEDDRRRIFCTFQRTVACRCWDSRHRHQPLIAPSTHAALFFGYADDGRCLRCGRWVGWPRGANSFVVRISPINFFDSPLAQCHSLWYKRSSRGQVKRCLSLSAESSRKLETSNQ